MHAPTVLGSIYIYIYSLLDLLHIGGGSSTRQAGYNQFHW